MDCCMKLVHGHIHAHIHTNTDRHTEAHTKATSETFLHHKLCVDVQANDESQRRTVQRFQVGLVYDPNE